MSRRAISINEEFLIFYQELGTAITNWSVVEAALSRVVASALPKVRNRTVAAGFFAIENFRSKLKFVDEIVHEQLSVALVHMWDPMHNRAESLAIQRNKIVHRVPLRILAQTSPGKRVVLIPPNFNRSPASAFVSKKGRQILPRDTVTIHHIMLLRRQFAQLSEALSQFAIHLEGGPKPTQGLLEQSIALPTMRDLVAHIYSTLQVQPIPSVRSRKAGS